MSFILNEVRRGAYFDSIVLMRLQGRLIDLGNVIDAEVVMATEDNLDRLESRALLEVDRGSLQPDDLLIVIEAEDQPAAHAAADRVDQLLAERAEGGEQDFDDESDFQPRSLETAVKRLPHAQWVSISVPGSYAARVARRALELDRHVFLYSDNVPLEDELELKRKARQRGLLMLGPDCGTTIVGGVGFGFANRVERGPIGIIGASGTGIQAVCSRLDRLAIGISHAIGIGGRDLSSSIGGISALQAFDALDRDPQTEVIVLISKPPDAEIAAQLISRAQRSDKPVVFWFPTFAPPARRVANLWFALGSTDAAHLAAQAASRLVSADREAPVDNHQPDGDHRRYLRGLFSGGTLAFEVLAGLRGSIAGLSSNLELAGVTRLNDLEVSVGHTLIDLGDDQLTVGRPHPMLDPSLRVARFQRELEDPETAVIVLDVVLGDGADQDPVSAFESTLESLRTARSAPLVIVLLVGTDKDPQQFEHQAARFAELGAVVVEDPAAAIELITTHVPTTSPQPRSAGSTALDPSPAIINVGIEDFAYSFRARAVECIHVDWRPPAGGNPRMIELIDFVRDRSGAEAPSP